MTFSSGTLYQKCVLLHNPSILDRHFVKDLLTCFGKEKLKNVNFFFLVEKVLSDSSFIQRLTNR